MHGGGLIGANALGPDARVLTAVERVSERARVGIHIPKACCVSPGKRRQKVTKGENGGKKMANIN